MRPSYFLFGVDPGIWKERSLERRRPGRHELRSDLLGRVLKCQRERPIFKNYFAAGAPKGVTSSVSLLYYDYVHMLAEAWEKAGSTDPDKTVAALESLHHKGVVSDDLSFNKSHQVTHATEVCAAAAGRRYLLRDAATSGRSPRGISSSTRFPPAAPRTGGIFFIRAHGGPAGLRNSGIQPWTFSFNNSSTVCRSRASSR